MESLKINNNIYITKEYFIKESLSEMKFIKDIKFTENSIIIFVKTINNDMFKYVLNAIIVCLAMYLYVNFNMDFNNNLEYLRNKFKKLEIERI